MQSALDYVEDKLSAQPITEPMWQDVVFMLTVFAPHNEKAGGESLFSRVQSIAARKEDVLMEQAYALRDAMKTTPGGREICENLPEEMGTAECADAVDKLAAWSHEHFVQSNASELEQLDAHVCMPLLHLTAAHAQESFAEKLRALFPDAVDDAGLLGDGQPASFAVSLGPLKGEPRIHVKMSEYREANEQPDKWIFSTRVSERASVCRS